MMEVRELNKQQKEELRQLFGNWVNFGDERKYYDHDIGAMPSLVKPFLGRTEPAAVVKALSEEDVVKLLKWASKHEVPVVPRAAASSGYGGIIPSKGGIVLDVTSLKGIYSIDRENLVAEVGAGTVWEDLERQLEPHGLAPRQVPSSAPASTVGGWFAQGGTGYGGFAYGWFIESVVRVRLIDASGEVREFSGSELEAVYGTMGALGVITRVWLKLRPKEEIIPVLIAFDSARSLAEAIKEVYLESLELYTLNFINPEGASLKNRLPVRTHHGHPEEKSVKLPEKFLLLAGVFSSKQAEIKRLEEIAARNGGVILSDELAAHEWEERYKPMKVKRIGPSIIPAEVVVPLNSLYTVISELEHHIKLPFLIEGTAVKNKEIVLLVLIPHDERRFSYNFAFGLSLSVLKTALKYGGRPYSSGLYFGGYARRVYGASKLEQVKKLKKELDPREILNPEKIEGKKAWLICWVLPVSLSLLSGCSETFSGYSLGKNHLRLKAFRLRLPGMRMHVLSAVIVLKSVTSIMDGAGNHSLPEGSFTG